MTAELLADAEALRRSLSRFEPELLSGADCAAVVEKLAVLEKTCSAALLRAAARVKACGAQSECEVFDPAAWLARLTGTTTGSAKAALQTQESLADCPATEPRTDRR